MMKYPFVSAIVVLMSMGAAVRGTEPNENSPERPSCRLA